MTVLTSIPQAVHDESEINSGIRAVSRYPRSVGAIRKRTDG
ncbi:hypothetical protein [Burkholderia multivorans]|nr:hypothetical protein [Burkholderia multivorans]